MKWTLAHSPVALDALLQWYPLHDQIAPVLGERRTWLFCHAISTAERLPDLLHVLPAAADRRGRGPVGPQARRVRRADRGPRSPAGRRPALRRRRAARALAERLTLAADRDADRLRRDHGRHQRVQRRDGRGARRLPRAVRGVIAFITGAAHGQGRATALALAEDGYDIVALDVAAQLSYPAVPDGLDRGAGLAAGRGRGPRARVPDGRRRRARLRGRRRRRDRRDRALRPDRRAVQQRRHLRLRARPRADRARVGRDARHQPQGRVDRRPPGDPAHDRRQVAA